MKPPTIFIRTWHRDVPWLKNSLRSLQRWTEGFGEVVIHCDPADEKAVASVVGTHRLVTSPIWATKGYVNQQVVKLHADLWVPEGLVTFVDSDLIFYANTRPETLLKDGKPILLHTPWEKVGEANMWKEPTKEILGWEPPFEFMRRIPLTYHTDTLKALRKHIEERHGRSASSYLGARPKLSEFNAIGAFAWEKQRDSYHWIHTEENPLPASTSRQYWSWGGLTPAIQAEIDALFL